MTEYSSKIEIKEKPQICAIDLDQEIIEALRDKGLQCFSGTLGSQIKVPNSSIHNTHPCRPNFYFPPNLHEYDIIIVDLQERDPIQYNELEHTNLLLKGSEQQILLSKFPERIFDPRPFSAKLLNQKIRDFSKKNALIIVFSARQETIRYSTTKLLAPGYLGREEYIYCSLYDFLPFIENISNKTGRNIVTLNQSGNLEIFLNRYSSSFRYQAIFGHPRCLNEKREYAPRISFFPLLVNADSEIVGFSELLCYPLIFYVFPQLIDRKKDFVVELFNEILPEIFPQIFPYNDQFSWLKLSNYLLPNQLNYLEKKEKIQEEYKKALEQIENEIQQNQVKYQFLHNLLSETGDSLVKSVEQFLSWLGFPTIINMDETNPDMKEEDIQIPLENGLLVIEIKGIGGTSKDGECSQINKIKYRRAKERDRFDVFALYLVNHQRYLPPHARRNPPFTEQQILDAESEERGLLTTYDFFKLYSNIENGFVTKEDARYSLLQYGLVKFKPSNANFIGIPLELHHQGTVVILKINNILLFEGATIIVCNDGFFSKAEILEIQDNDKKVKSASNGEIGVKLSRSVLRKSELWLHHIHSST